LAKRKAGREEDENYKLQITNYKQITMSEITNHKKGNCHWSLVIGQWPMVNAQ
jgi:hypothetical protein